MNRGLQLIAHAAPILLALTMSCPSVRGNQIFSGTSPSEWRVLFGTRVAPVFSLALVPTTPTAPPVLGCHVELNRNSVVGTDFIYSARVMVGDAPGTDGQLVFRISDLGRYGVSIRRNDVRLFVMRPSLTRGDAPQFEILGQALLDPNISTHNVAVTASGFLFAVSIDGVVKITYLDQASDLRAGTFGAYGFIERSSSNPTCRPIPGGTVTFDMVGAVINGAPASNFALSYSTFGYDLHATKRAFLRTVTDIAPEKVDLNRSVWRLIRYSPSLRFRIVALKGSLGPPNKVFGAQLWEIDFSRQQFTGKYFLNVEINDTLGGRLATLNSEPFEIGTYQFTRRVLPWMVWANASERAATGDEERHNWSRVSGTAQFHSELASLESVPAGTIELTGDRLSGAELRRTQSDWIDCPPNPPPGFNPEPACNFTLVAQVTLLNGCDAQLQFHITESFRYGVTLLSGKCGLGVGPGAVRLHKEGSAVPGGFNTIALQSFPVLAPLAFSHPYLVKIIAVGRNIRVFVDDALMLNQTIDDSPAPGGFALKAWGSEARFDYVQAWDSKVNLLTGSDHVPVPSTISPAGTSVHCDLNEWPKGTDPTASPFHDVCHPIFALRHGFHDCNNIIGEANSHGVFLNGLVGLWAARSRRLPGSPLRTPLLSASNQDKLKTAILTAVDYLTAVYRQENSSGQFAHEEWGRANPEQINKFNTQLAVYGLSAFAAFASDIDLERARRACVQSARGIRWLEGGGSTQWPDPEIKSVVYAQLAICIKDLDLAQDPQIRGVLGNSPSDAARDLAIVAANAQLQDLGHPIATPVSDRCTTFSHFNQHALRTTPVFEGIFLLKTQFASAVQNMGWDTLLEGIKTDLIQNIAFGTGFEIVPQTDGRPTSCWPDRTGVPQPPPDAIRDLPGVFWYTNMQIATSAVDVLLLEKMTQPQVGLERIATASLGWITGLGPGVPGFKTVNSGCKPAALNNDSWQSAAFIRGLDSRFAQGYVNFLDPDPKNFSSGQAKSSPNCWELAFSAGSGKTTAGSPKAPPWQQSRAREVWWFDPPNNSFMTLVNGYVIDNGRWSYLNEGKYGWYSGETFLLEDGLFIKASILYEDYLGSVALWRVPKIKKPLHVANHP